MAMLEESMHIITTGVYYCCILGEVRFVHIPTYLSTT